MKAFVTTLILTLVMVTAGKDVHAQLTTIPVSMSPKEIPELTTVVVHGDFGFYNHNLGDFKSVGGRVVWNPAKFSVLAGAGVLLAEENQADNGFTMGTALGYDIRPGSAEPWKPIIQLKGGIGYTKIADFKQWDFPFSLGASEIRRCSRGAPHSFALKPGGGAKRATPREKGKSHCLKSAIFV